MLGLLVAVSLSVTPLEASIHQMAPHLPMARVTRVASLVSRVAAEYHLPAETFAAIVRQESRFQSGGISCVYVRRHRHSPEELTCDLGIAQVNEHWIQTWHLDPVRLVSDDLYNLRAAARILAQLQRTYGATEARWWGRYNTATPSKRAVYEYAVLSGAGLLPPGGFATAVALR